MGKDNELITLVTILYSASYCEEEWIYAEYVRRLLGISPFSMCRTLNEGKFCFESAEVVYIETDHDVNRH